MTVKMTEEQYARLEAEAKARGVSLSAVIRESLAADSRTRLEPSLLDRMEGIAGAVDGPADLSTDKQYMKDYGLSRPDRHRPHRRRR